MKQKVLSSLLLLLFHLGLKTKRKTFFGFKSFLSFVFSIAELHLCQSLFHLGNFLRAWYAQHDIKQLFEKPLYHDVRLVSHAKEILRNWFQLPNKNHQMCSGVDSDHLCILKYLWWWHIFVNLPMACNTHQRHPLYLLPLLSFSLLLIHYLWSCSIMTSVVKSILLRTTSRALKWKLQPPHLRREKVEDDEEEDDDGKFRRSRLMIKTDYVPQIADGGWTSFAFAASNSFRSFFFIRDTKF